MSKKKEQQVDYSAERIYRVKFLNGKTILVSETNLTAASQANNGISSMKRLDEALFKPGYNYSSFITTGTTIPWTTNKDYADVSNTSGAQNLVLTTNDASSISDVRTSDT